MNSANYEETRRQLKNAIKNIRPGYQLDNLYKALFSLAFEYLWIKINLTYRRWRYSK